MLGQLTVYILKTWKGKVDAREAAEQKGRDEEDGGFAAWVESGGR